MPFYLYTLSFFFFFCKLNLVLTSLFLTPSVGLPLLCLYVFAGLYFTQWVS